MARRSLMLMRKKGLLGSFFGKHANNNTALSKSVGSYYDVNGAGAYLKMVNSAIEDIAVVINFNKTAYFNEGIDPTGMTVTNLVTAEVAGHVAQSGNGTAQMQLTVSWVTAPVFGDILSVEYTGGGFVIDDDGELEQGVIACHNVLNIVPENTVAPEISGSGVVGTDLVCFATGAWTGQPDSFEYSWSGDGYGFGTDTYTVEGKDAGIEQDCRVQARNQFGVSPWVHSNAIEAAYGAPINTSPPVISGNTSEGSVLSCSTGAWANPVTTFAYDWERDGVSTGQTSNTYLVELDDAGADMACVVTATNAIGSNEATSNTLVMDGGVVPVITHYPDFLGYEDIEVSDITPVINMNITSASAPTVIQCTCEGTIATGTDLLGNPVNPDTMLEYRWKLIDSNGVVPVLYDDGVLEPNSQAYINPYTDQVKPTATFPIYKLESDTYTVIMTARAPDGAGGYTSAVTTSDFTVTGAFANTSGMVEKWVDSANGDDTNSGHDAWGLVYSGGTYSNGIVTAVGAFTLDKFNPVPDTVNPNHRDNYLWIVGALRRVERIDDDSISIHADSQAGISATGLESDSTNGALETFSSYIPATTEDVTYRLKGGEDYPSNYHDLGTTHKYTSLTMLRYGATGETRIHPASSMNQLMRTYPQVKVYISGIEFDGEGLTTAIPVQCAPNDVDTTTAMNHIFDNSTIRDDTGTHSKPMSWQDTAEDTRAAGVYAMVNCVLSGKFETTTESRTSPGYWKIPAPTWISFIGVNATADCVSQTYDHYFYISGGTKRRDLSYNWGHGAKAGFYAGYMFNDDVHEGGTSFANLTVHAYNRATECERFSEGSNINNTPAYYFDNMVNINNYCDGSRGHILTQLVRKMVSLNEICNPLNPATPNPIFFQSNQPAVGVQSDWYASNAIVINAYHSATHADYIGDSNRIMKGAKVLRDGADVELEVVNSALLDDSHYWENNYYNADKTDVINDSNGGDCSVSVYNTRIDTAGGTGLNTSNLVAFQDVSALNFLPIGFESLAPTINTQPVATFSLVDGEYMSISADFDQATSHQWQKDDVDIAGATSPVLTYKMATADSGAVFTCIGTNASGSITTSGCALVEPVTRLFLTFNGVNTYLKTTTRFVLNPANSDYVEIKFKRNTPPSSVAYLFNNNLGGTNLQVGFNSDSTLNVPGSLTGVSIDGGAEMVNGADISTFYDGDEHVLRGYPNGATNLSLSIIGIFNDLSINPYDSVLYDLVISRTGVLYTWNIDTGTLDGGTDLNIEDSSEALNYHNVVEGDWS